MTTDKPAENRRAARGFAALSPEKRSEISSKGGKAVPNQSRAFYLDNTLAKVAGAKGGKGVPAEKRAFSLDRDLAARSGSAKNKRAQNAAKSSKTPSTLGREEAAARGSLKEAKAGTKELGRKSKRGFAAMSLEKRLEISRKGGFGVPPEKRYFATHKDGAAAAGKKGGRGRPKQSDA